MLLVKNSNSEQWLNSTYLFGTRKTLDHLRQRLKCVINNKQECYYSFWVWFTYTFNERDKDKIKHIDRDVLKQYQQLHCAKDTFLGKKGTKTAIVLLSRHAPFPLPCVK